MDFLYPIPEHRKEVYSFYKLTFTPDGCPMKTMPNGEQVFHPILAAYLIYEYVRWWEDTKDVSYLEHATRIADQALALGDEFEGALVFWYLPETNLSSIPRKFYSALTQARYIYSLLALRRHVDGAYDSSIRRIFQSLMIPVSRGGCFIEKDWGWVVEEYPNDPPLYTLNGWMTVIMMIAECRSDLIAVDIDANFFLQQNFKAIKHLLPLYDAEFCANSRYQLTGFSRIKLVFEKPPTGELESFYIEIPGEGSFKGDLEKGDSRWKYFVEREDGRIKQFNVLLSLVSYPEPNVLRISYRSVTKEKAKVFIAQGNYDPNLSGMPTTSWLQIGEIEVGGTDLSASIDLPYDAECLFAYPTNFKKKIGGRYFNAYHYVHISDLAWLYAYTDELIFKKTALKWFDYVSIWPSMSSLQRTDVSFDPLHHDAHGFKKLLLNIFSKQVVKIRI